MRTLDDETKANAPSTCVSEPDYVPWPEELVRRYTRKGYWLGEPLGHLLQSSALQFPQKVALVCGQRRTTYQELWLRTEQLARALRGLGVGPGDRVVVHLGNVCEAVETLFALFRLGAIPIMALPGHRLSEIVAFVRHAEAMAYVGMDFLGDFDCRVLGRELLGSPKTSLRTVVIVGQSAEFVDYHGLVTDRKCEQEPDSVLPDVDARTIALLQLSGGSTGTPKLIPRTHDDYFYSVRRSVEVCGFDASTKYLLALPWAHNFPMSSPGFLGCLVVGGTVVLTQDASPDAVFPIMLEEAITHVAAVPPLAMAWLHAARQRKLRLNNLVALQVGGAKLTQEQAEQLWDGFGGRLQQVFGMAEGLVCYTALDAPRSEVISTQGRPMSPDDEICIVDDEDTEVPQGRSGHLLTRGPYTIRGYYRASNHRSAFTSDGFYRTGDIVAQDERGNLTVTGRAKCLINRGGEKVAPAEVEAHLLTHDGVVAVAVAGAADPLMGERICAFVVPSSRERPSRSALLAHLRERGLAEYKLPDRITWVDHLPTTGVGKVDTRQLLKAQAMDGATCEGGDELIGELAALLQLDPRELSPTANLVDLGLESVHLMMLVERLQERGTEVHFMELAELRTLSDLQRLLGQKRAL